MKLAEQLCDCAYGQGYLFFFACGGWLAGDVPLALIGAGADVTDETGVGRGAIGVGACAAAGRIGYCCGIAGIMSICLARRGCAIVGAIIICCSMNGVIPVVEGEGR